MEKHYDTRLREWFPSNTERHKLVMNKEFVKWDSQIKEKLCTRKGSHGYFDEADLLWACQDHIDEHSKEIVGEEVISLIHPFYLSLSHMRHISTDATKEDLGHYIQNIRKLFDKKPREIIVLDTIHNYAAITSKLLEEGFVDKVILTYFMDGYPLRREKLKILNNKKNFIGGGYYSNTYHRCLNQALKCMKQSRTRRDIWLIKDLVLQSPQETKQLFPDKIKGIPKEKIINLEDLF